VGYGWIIATLAASGFQVARNGLQRSLMPSVGPWGATLVRFLFGLPFSLTLAAIALMSTPSAGPRFTIVFLVAAALGGACQIVATAALLIAMRRAGFAVATAVQQSALPLAAIIGLVVFHDQLHALSWMGVAVTTAGLVVLTWPRQAGGPQPISGALFGLLSGLAFGFSLNAFRHAGLELAPAHPVVSALVTVSVVQALQTIALGGALLVWAPGAPRAVIAGWRQSLGAGLCGSIASALWFVSLALAPAASVRAVGVVEAPMAAIAGHRLFNERLGLVQLIAGAAVAAGVVLTAIG
jgi:drug/metabolite transporter (DMT)-like permease